MVKVLPKTQAESMGTIASPEKRREHRNMALLRDPLFTILPTTRSSNQWEETSMASIDPCCDTRRRVCLRSAQKVLPKSKRCDQRGDMTSGKCKLFGENGSLAKTRGSGKMCSRPSRYQPVAPDNVIPYGRPWKNQEMPKKQ